MSSEETSEHQGSGLDDRWVDVDVARYEGKMKVNMPLVAASTHPLLERSLRSRTREKEQLDGPAQHSHMRIAKIKRRTGSPIELVLSGNEGAEK